MEIDYDRLENVLLRKKVNEKTRLCREISSQYKIVLEPTPFVLLKSW